MRVVSQNIVAIAVAFVMSASVVRPGDAETPTATELYRRALVVMNGLEQPAFVTTRLEATGDGLRADLTRERGCDHVRLSFGNDRSDWMIRHRTRDAATEIVDERDGQRYVSGAVDPATGHPYLSSYDPTWLSTYQALRTPLLIPRIRCAPLPPTPAPQPTESPHAGPALQVIGTVAAIGPGIYAVEDRGAATCANGSPGRALHLWSRTHNPRQTLSDVVIELSSMRFCTVRFGMRRSGIGFDGIVEEHFGEVGRYWIQTDGFVETTARIMGIASGHGTWRYRFVDTQYPDALPSDAFAPGASGNAA